MDHAVAPETSDKPASGLPSRLERCSAAAVRALADRIIIERSRGTAMEWAGGSCVCLTSDHPLNGIRGAGIAAAPDESDWARAEAAFAGLNAEMSIELSPLASPQLLRDVRARGLTLRGFQSVRYKWIERGELFTQSARGSGVVIVRIDGKDEGELDAWDEVMLAASASEPAPVPSGWVAARTWSALSEACLMLTLVDGHAVGAAAMWVREGVALLCDSGVHPEHRRRGLHTMLLQARLGLAQEMRCDLCQLIAPPGGGADRSGQRLGFELAYTRSCVARPEASTRAAA